MLLWSTTGDPVTTDHLPRGSQKWLAWNSRFKSCREGSTNPGCSLGPRLIIDIYTNSQAGELRAFACSLVCNKTIPWNMSWRRPFGEITTRLFLSIKETYLRWEMWPIVAVCSLDQSFPTGRHKQEWSISSPAGFTLNSGQIIDIWAIHHVLLSVVYFILRRDSNFGQISSVCDFCLFSIMEHKHHTKVCTETLSIYISIHFTSKFEESQRNWRFYSRHDNAARLSLTNGRSL